MRKSVLTIACFFVVFFFVIGLFETRILEYREEMAEVSKSIRTNMKEVGRKMVNFFKESGRYRCLSI